jgi:excisionase family DNA binding protein
MTACQIIAIAGYHPTTIMTGYAPMSGPLTASQAAKLVNKSPSTIRRLIKQGKLPSTISSEGWKVVTKTDLMVCFRERLQQPSKKPASDHPEMHSSPSQTAMDALKTALETANKTIDHERSLVRSCREENKILQSELLQITHEMKSILAKENKSVLSRWIRS